ncbi:DUF7264 domain-containing protein [Nocardia brasiliensis]|uniref:LtfC-like domain-containing protein n=1 Tax=Nocardia brasiliensis TaxID=37326 RepID=UPI002454AC59|nr:hypothetical protein [Nocardia brasiliensis]
MAIGNEPIVETLFLVKGQDFIHEILPPVGEDVPTGTTAELIFYDAVDAEIATWDASVTPTSISWDVASALADTINIPAYFRIYVHYTDGADFCWFRGAVARK